jgi:hypothetical protein
MPPPQVVRQQIRQRQLEQERLHRQESQEQLEPPCKQHCSAVVQEETLEKGQDEKKEQPVAAEEAKEKDVEKEKPRTTGQIKVSIVKKGSKYCVTYK